MTTNTVTVEVSFNEHWVDFPHEKRIYAVFYALMRGHVIAVCQVEPWGISTTIRPFVSGFHVTQGFRRRGIGRALLRFLLKRAEENGIPSLAMWVHKDNAAAAALYRSEGFQAFYQDGDNIFFGRQIGGASCPK